jgi:hypothetical protein
MEDVLDVMTEDFLAYSELDAHGPDTHYKIY